MLILNNLIDNQYVIYGSLTSTAGLITYLVIKSYFKVIETPNSPPTFNLTHEQTQELQEIMDSSVIQGQTQELQEITDSEETNSVIQGQIRDLPDGSELAERVSYPFFMTPQERLEIKHKLESGERLSAADKQNLDTNFNNIEKMGEYADSLDEIIAQQKEEFLEISDLI